MVSVVLLSGALMFASQFYADGMLALTKRPSGGGGDGGGSTGSGSSAGSGTAVGAETLHQQGGVSFGDGVALPEGPPGRFDGLPPEPVPPCEVIGLEARMPRCAPRIIIIGAMKCGTNAVAEFMESHPSVQGVTENHYFALRYDAASDVRQEVEFLRLQPPLPGNYTLAVLATDRSPTYIYIPESAARYKAAFPDAKIVAILCDPVRRIASQYWHHRRFDNGSMHYTPQAMEKSLEEYVGVADDIPAGTPAFPSPPHCTTDQPDNPRYQTATPYRCRGVICDISAYTVGLRAWVEAYGEDRVFITEQEALKRDPGPILLQLLRFLRLDPADVPHESFRTRAVYTNAAKPRNSTMTRASCERLRAMFEPHNACLQDTYGHLMYPPMNVSTAWQGCDF